VVCARNIVLVAIRILHQRKWNVLSAIPLHNLIRILSFVSLNAGKATKSITLRLRLAANALFTSPIHQGQRDVSLATAIIVWIASILYLIRLVLNALHVIVQLRWTLKL
jgi:hypothetical protein